MSSVADCSALCKPSPLLLSAAGASAESAEPHTTRWGCFEHLGKRPRTPNGRGVAAGPQGQRVGPAMTFIQRRWLREVFSVWGQAILCVGPKRGSPINAAGLLRARMTQLGCDQQRANTRSSATSLMGAAIPRRTPAVLDTMNGFGWSALPAHVPAYNLPSRSLLDAFVSATVMRCFVPCEYTLVTVQRAIADQLTVALLAATPAWSRRLRCPPRLPSLPAGCWSAGSAPRPSWRGATAAAVGAARWLCSAACTGGHRKREC